MIQDFGQKINGAAKDRWGKFRTALQTDQAAVVSLPLSKSFPEPDYKKLLAEGADLWAVSFIRTVRETIGTKPRSRCKLPRWVQQVENIRALCRNVLDGDLTQDIWEKGLESGDIRDFSTIAEKIRLYQHFGHDQSLKDIQISTGYYSMFEGVKYEPSKLFHVLSDAKTRKRYVGETRAEAIAKLEVDIVAKKEVEAPKAAKKVKFNIYTSRATGAVYIGKKIGKDIVRIQDFADIKSARTHLNENYDEVLERFEKMKSRPRYRSDENAPREGQDWRHGQDVTPEQFSEAFNFRGVQFGNYVEQSRRQEDLNNAYDALMDLALVLKCAPDDLSLQGKLGLAFGARGRGGADPASAHFEPDEFVINLTKTKGAGSLAHEWFHAIDNLTVDGSVSLAPFGSAQGARQVQRLSLDQGQQVMGMIHLRETLRQQTGVDKRCKALDKYRSSPYFSLAFEETARAFEVWVIGELAEQGIKNDYLANVQDQAVFEAFDKLCGFEESRYPYPTAEELEAVVKPAYDTVFGPDAPIRKIIPFEEKGPSKLALPEGMPAPKAEDELDEIETEMGLA